jgi:hypothetical protein
LGQHIATEGAASDLNDMPVPVPVVTDESQLRLSERFETESQLRQHYKFIF